MKRKKIVAVIGRPNVGKSTLFNALAGKDISIVKDTPGVTRDRIYQDVEWLNQSFTLIDTGGIEPDSKDIILSQMREQAEIAIETADVILFLCDVKQGPTDADHRVADLLRKSGKPVILAVNKVDNFQKEMLDTYEFYQLGIGDPHPISAAGRLGIGDLLEEITTLFPKETREEEEEDAVMFIGEMKKDGERVAAHCLVGKILLNRDVNKDGLRYAMQQAWKTTKEIKVESQGDNIFVFKLATEHDKKKVLTEGPWHFDKALIVLVEPMGMGGIKRQPFTHTSFWVQIHRMPIKCMVK